MKFAGSTYKLMYDPIDQQINFEGILRLANPEDSDKLLSFLKQIHNGVRGTLRLSFRKLRYMNAEGIRILSAFIRFARQENSLKIKVIASAVLAWSERVLPNLCKLWDQVEFSIYDRDFYKSQTIIEDNEFIPLLRNQTRILWPLEKETLILHGIKQGMKVADICCGCGDVPLLISRELRPSFILGIDHSEAAILHARQTQEEFHILNADFQRGDATALMLDDNSFDFVSCRLSLQIFSEPQLILQELIRITKPGGRIYTICEDYDLIVGEPEEQVIHQTYEKAAAYGDALGMDLRSGKKLFRMLTESRLEDIRVSHIIADTNNTNRETFAKVIESWKAFSVDTIGDQLDLSASEKAILLAGYDAQLRTIRNPNGYTTWPVIACSGRKPL